MNNVITKKIKKTVVPKVDEVYTYKGMNFKVVDIDYISPKGADILFGRIKLQPNDGGQVWDITLGDFFHNQFQKV